VTASPNWIELQGGVNARDVGGMPTSEDGQIRPGVLIRSANLQHLTDVDVRRLVGELGVRRIVDLRTDIEVDRTGPGPLHDVPDVTIHHLSLYPDVLDAEESHNERPPDVLMPWHGKNFASEHGPVVASYLQYLERRPDSILAALRAIAEPDGATVVHCAAGKDRTGVVIALALAVAGVPNKVIAADYAATESQLAAIVAHLARSDLYSREVSQPDRIPTATAEIMLSVLEAVDAEFGGVLGWLRAHGWTEDETTQLRAKLRG
jgi:protein tyrosine/serine phosphatase